MQEQALQAAFEIKAACDEISRRLLRWHWERKPGAHTLDSLLQYIAQRQKESPDYYDRMPDLSGKTSWQQLDTTICMRVLLDPEKDASHPVDLLENTEHPGAARRACNAVRVARNEAAHAADRTDAAQAAILFNEAVENLEEGYAGTAFRENELAGYYREAEEFLSRCGAKEPVASARSAPEKEDVHSSRKRAENRKVKSRSGQGKNTKRTEKRSSGKETAHSGKARGKVRRHRRGSPTVLVILLAAVVLGLLVRAFTMGLI